jgi:hypothetical protein
VRLKQQDIALIHTLLHDCLRTPSRENADQEAVVVVNNSRADERNAGAGRRGWWQPGRAEAPDACTQIAANADYTSTNDTAVTVNTRLCGPRLTAPVLWDAAPCPGLRVR